MFAMIGIGDDKPRSAVFIGGGGDTLASVGGGGDDGGVMRRAMAGDARGEGEHMVTREVRGGDGDASHTETFRCFICRGDALSSASSEWRFLIDGEADRDTVASVDRRWRAATLGEATSVVAGTLPCGGH